MNIKLKPFEKKLHFEKNKPSERRNLLYIEISRNTNLKFSLLNPSLTDPDMFRKMIMEDTCDILKIALKLNKWPNNGNQHKLRIIKQMYHKYKNNDWLRNDKRDIHLKTFRYIIYMTEIWNLFPEFNIIFNLSKDAWFSVTVECRLKFLDAKEIRSWNISILNNTSKEILKSSIEHTLSQN